MSWFDLLREGYSILNSLHANYSILNLPAPSIALLKVLVTLNLFFYKEHVLRIRNLQFQSMI